MTEYEFLANLCTVGPSMTCWVSPLIFYEFSKMVLFWKFWEHLKIYNFINFEGLLLPNGYRYVTETAFQARKYTLDTNGRKMLVFGLKLVSGAVPQHHIIFQSISRC
jgi:hypothetical protein